MAGDYTIMEHATPRKPELLRIASATGRDRHQVLGLMMEFWAWAETMTVDGTIDIDLKSLATVMGGDVELWRAVRDAGWLETPNGETSAPIVIPRADHWLTNGAKSRLQKNRRQARWRAANPANTASVDREVDVGASTRAPTNGTERNGTEQNRTSGPSGFPDPDSGASGSGQRPDAVPGPSGSGESAFSMMTVDRLRDLNALRSWHKFQSGLSSPVIPSDVQEPLVLVVAAATKSLKKRNPVGYFASLVGKRNWNAITAQERESARRRIGSGC